MSEEKRQQRRRRRDMRRARRKIRTNPHINRILRFLTRAILTTVFRVSTEGLETVHRQRGAFLVVGNHSAVIDPFLVGCYMNRPIHFVASDSQFRSPVVSFLFGLLGVIPKTKVMADLDTVKKIVTVKQNGGIIGLFPEGQSGWDGHSLPIVKATDKLVKSLKVPVVAAQIRGAYFSWPRWGRTFRRGRITIHFKKILEPGDLRSLTVDEVGTILKEELTFDAFEYQRRKHIPFFGARRAEYLERALFICPRCNGVDLLHSHGQQLGCTRCGYTVRLTREGFFQPVAGPLRFGTIREWNLWQIEEFHRYIDGFLSRGGEGAARGSTAAGSGAAPVNDSTRNPAHGLDAILKEEAVLIQEGFKTRPLTPLGTGAMILYPDRLTMRPGTAELSVPIGKVEGINVQNNEHLEFYVEDTLYKISPVSPRGNTYKWDVAVRHLRNRHAAAAVG